jgi:E3 ubiquitin-protein ligase HUWE1
LLAKTPGMMDSFTGLLANITRPLSNVSAESSPKYPNIPVLVLRMVVNCLTIGECSSRTLGNTLLIIQNLSADPEAKKVILQELCDRSQALGDKILAELQMLTATLTSDDTIDAATLSTFTPASSSQAQLLRLLKTIDYLHLGKMDMEAPAGEMTEKEQAAGQVFAAFDFDRMWRQLGECLLLVEEKGGTDQISTVLLPLVEALMVICKYKGQDTSRATRSPSVPPTSGLETADLFVSFTTAHRKVLNAIVRSNPGLLGGSFSLLVRNPKVLEFDNKRNWFLQKLKRKRDQTTASSVLHLNIRRQYIFEDSFHALQRRKGDEIKYGKLSVKFYNEDGVDAGGVTREWYSVLAQQIFDPNFGEF